MWAHRAHCTCGVSLSRHLMNKNKNSRRRNRHVARVTLRSDALTVESNRNKWFEITNRNMHFNPRHFSWCRRLTDKFRKTQKKKKRVTNGIYRARWRCLMPNAQQRWNHTSTSLSSQPIGKQWNPFIRYKILNATDVRSASCHTHAHNFSIIFSNFLSAVIQFRN